MITANNCACMGPQNGEPLCPCQMRAARGHIAGWVVPAPQSGPPQSDEEVAEMIARFRTPPGFSWEPLRDDIVTLLKGRCGIASLCIASLCARLESEAQGYRSLQAYHDADCALAARLIRRSYGMACMGAPTVREGPEHLEECRACGAVVRGDLIVNCEALTPGVSVGEETP